MSKDILMQFEGFESNAKAREYSFVVREASKEPRHFTISIAQEAFNGRRVRFQDGPDVCALKLRRELAAFANDPPVSQFAITDADLEEYRSNHRSAKQSMYHRRQGQE